MNDVHTLRIEIVSEPAAIAGRADAVWSWYYVYFTEARLAAGEVVHH